MKNNKKIIWTVIILVLLTALAVGGYITIKNILFSEDENVYYGNRLDGINNVVVISSTESTLRETALEKEFISNLKLNVSGKIVNISITLKEEVSASDAKSIVPSLIKLFSEEQLAFYDIQVFLTASVVESEIYPLIGYKNKNNDTIVWSK